MMLEPFLPKESQDSRKEGSSGNDSLERKFWKVQISLALRAVAIFIGLVPKKHEKEMEIQVNYNTGPNKEFF